RLSPIPVLILYDVQSSQAVQLFLLLSFCLSLFAFILRVCFIHFIVEIIHQSLYALCVWRKLGKQMQPKPL
ncbi:TPA: hypothetical protein ACMDPC_002450, partial [Vibrio cholerae]